MTASAEHSRLSDDEDDDQDLDETPPKLTLAQKLRKKLDDNIPKIDFYATVFFSLLAIGAFFGFLFLVPFVIEPAVTTIQMDFEVEPVTCCVLSLKEASGAKNCSNYSSCREGCTRTVFNCTKILVAYTDAENFSCSNQPPDHQFLNDEATLYPNVKGCGYPPELNCTIFHDRFRDRDVTFPCYYSRVDPSLVITELDPEKTEQRLIMSIVAPVVAFVVSIAYLVHAYHRMKRKEEAAEAKDSLEKAQCLLEKEQEEEQVASRSNATSTYSIKSISSKINATMVRLARERRKESGSDGEAMEMEQVVPEVRPPSRYLRPGRMPSGNRHNLLEPLKPPVAEAAPSPAQSSSGKGEMSPVET